MYKLENGVYEQVKQFIAKYPLTNPFTEERASIIRQQFIELARNPNYENTLWAVMYWQRLVVTGEFTSENIIKLGWDYDNLKTEQEQADFTIALLDLLLEPASREALNKVIEYCDKNPNHRLTLNLQ